MAFNYNGVDLPYQQRGREGNSAQWLIDYFKQSFGRNPTMDEISQFLPIYNGGDKNITDVAAGNAAVARYHQQMNPTDQFKDETPKQYDTVNQLFQTNLGRDASQEEKDHFGQLLASKQYDPYTIAQVLQTLPEHVKQQDAAFQKEFNDTQQKQDAQYYNEQIMPGIQSAFAAQGRDVRSSGFANALAQAATQQNRQREGFLSNLTAQQYQNSQANARADYLGNYAYTQGRSNQLADQNTSRLNDIENFNMQKQAYDQYLSRYGKRSPGWMDYTNLALNGVNSFANAYSAGKGGGGGVGALPYGQI